MASVKRYVNKEGDVVSIQIRVFRGEDEKGKSLKPYQKSVKVPKGMTPRQLQKYEQEQAILFEKACREGLVSDSSVLFRDFAKAVMETKRVAGVEESTLNRYQDILDARLIPYFGHLKVRDISSNLLNRFYKEMMAPGTNRRTGGSLSPKTVLEFHRLLSSIFTEAKKQHVILHNPAEAASPPKAARKVVNYFQPEDLAKIKRAFDTEPIKWKAMGYLFMTYGDRRSEFAGSCLDFQRHEILISGSVLYTPRKGVYEKAYPKNEKGRYLPMPPEIEAVLKEHLVWLDAEKEKWGDLWTDTDYLFTGERGGMMNPDVITKYFARMSERHQKADPSFPHINPHAFRHTVVSLLLHNGMDFVSVADYVGDDPATIAKHYAHLVNAGKLRAVDTMRGIFNAQNAG